MDNKCVDNFIDDILNCLNNDNPKKILVEYLENKQIGVKGNLITLKINSNIKSRGRPRKTLVNNNNPNIKNFDEINDDNNENTQGSYIQVRKLNSNMYESMNGELFDVCGVECV